jgi:hypothetical protein
MFAQFIEQLRECKSVKSLQLLEDDLLNKISKYSLSAKSIREGRGQILQLWGIDLLVCGCYLALSLMILWIIIGLPI